MGLLGDRLGFVEVVVRDERSVNCRPRRRGSLHHGLHAPYCSWLGCERPYRNRHDEKRAITGFGVWNGMIET